MAARLEERPSALLDYEKRWLGDLPAEHRLLINAGESETFFALPPQSLQAVVWSRGAARSTAVPQALSLIAAALQPGGRLLLHDTIVPGSRLRGKKARREREAGDYINTWVRYMDPTHQRYFTADRWHDMLGAAGLRVIYSELELRAVDFGAWVGDTPRPAADVIRLEAMLLQAPEKVGAFLTPLSSPARITFQFTDCFILTELAH